MTLCDIDCIELTKEPIKIVGIHFSYNKKLENEENFIRHVQKIEKVLFSKLYQYLKLYTFLWSRMSRRKLSAY